MNRRTLLQLFGLSPLLAKLGWGEVAQEIVTTHDFRGIRCCGRYIYVCSQSGVRVIDTKPDEPTLLLDSYDVTWTCTPSPLRS